MNLKCLVIVYDFPPFAGGGVMRAHKYVKYLPEFGIEPIVLTVKDEYYLSKDKTLLNEYKTKINIIRTPVIDLKYYYNILKSKKKSNTVKEIFGVDRKSYITRFFDNLSASFFIPDLKVLWLPFCIFYAIRIIKKYNIKNILISSPPHSVQLAGIILKKIFSDIKIISDFRDLWTDYEVYTYPFSYVKKIEEFMEYRVLKNSDKIICATESIVLKFTEKYKDINKSKFKVITNGFDPEDYESIISDKNSSIYKPDDILKILYSGSLNDWRNLDNLIEALKKLISSKTIDVKKIKIKLCGHITYRDTENIKKNGLENIFDIIPMENHRESIKRLAEADILLLLIGKLEGKEVLTGKLFEYIGAKKNIFGIVPPGGEAYNLIKKYNLGFTADTDSAKNIAEKLQNIYNLFSEKKIKFNGNPEILNFFSRKSLAGSLAKTIEEIS